MDSHALYSLVAPQGYESALPVDDADYKVLSRIVDEHSVPRSPVRMELLRRDVGELRVRKKALMPSYSNSSGLILRDEAIDGVLPILGSLGFVVPLACADARLVFFTAAQVPNLIDLDASKVTRLPNSSRIINVNHLVVRAENLRQQRVFKLSEWPVRLYFASDLVAEIEATGLTVGMEFKVAGQVI